MTSEAGEEVSVAVSVAGTSCLLDGVLCVVPFAPPNVEQRTDCAVRLIGGSLPPADTRVVVEGLLDESVLTVTAWSSARDDESAWYIDRTREGVDATTADQVLDDLPEEWDLISTGVSTVRNGNKLAVVEVVRETEQVRAWHAARHPGSLVLFPFIRELPEAAAY